MQHRITTFALIAAVFSAAAIALVSWDRTNPPDQIPIAEAAVPVATPHDTPALSVPVSNSVPAPSTPPTEAVSQWIAESASGDAQKRAAAIKALANAPRADALPVLRRLLTDGEPLVDRRLALNSLRELALAQGDADGGIREAVRHAIYHGDDYTPAREAQEVLDIIEESEMKQPAQEPVSESQR